MIQDFDQFFDAGTCSIQYRGLHLVSFGIVMCKCVANFPELPPTLNARENALFLQLIELVQLGTVFQRFHKNFEKRWKKLATQAVLQLGISVHKLIDVLNGL